MFMRNTLGECLPCFTTKLPEAVDLHPCQSDTGLVTLQKLFYERRLVFVRTVRHPVQIVESFVHLRSTKPDVPRARDDDKAVRRWITSESTGVLRQRLQVKENCRRYGHAFVEVRYEDLSTDEGKDRFAERLAAAIRSKPGGIRTALSAFGNSSKAYAGRLRSGVRDVLGPERRAWWEHALGPIIKREGY